MTNLVIVRWSFTAARGRTAGTDIHFAWEVQAVFAHLRCSTVQEPGFATSMRFGEPRNEVGEEVEDMRHDCSQAVSYHNC